MRKRRHLDDWDPTNPYHIHTEDGQKVVFTKEAYNKLPDSIKQQIDAHYKEMNTFENKYQTTEEYKDFLQKVANSHVADDVKASIQEKYLDKNWYDKNWKSGAYSFDDKGLMTYNGQTYAPFGDNSKEGIVVPLRDTSGSSYGHNVVYYPYTIPEQYVERTPELVNNTIEENAVDEVIKAKNIEKQKYITDNTKFRTPTYSGIIFNPNTNSIFQYYPEAYDYLPYERIDDFYSDIYSKLRAKPILTRTQYNSAVKQVVDAFNNTRYLIANHSRVNPVSREEYDTRVKPLTVKEYLKYYLVDDKVEPSKEELNNFLNNNNITIEDLRSISNKKEEKKRSLKNGGIYIKPSHRGRFTALKERTGHASTWFKENGTPAQKKMATFALNAAKWKH